MPSAPRSGAPMKAKARMRRPAMSVPRHAMRRRNGSGAPRISAAKIAAVPTGSMMTKSATTPWRICSSIAASLRRRRHRPRTLGQEVPDRSAGAEIPGTKPLDRYRLEAGELAHIEYDLADGRHVVGDDHLIHAGERI